MGLLCRGCLCWNPPSAVVTPAAISLPEPKQDSPTACGFPSALRWPESLEMSFSHTWPCLSEAQYGRAGGTAKQQVRTWKRAQCQCQVFPKVFLDFALFTSSLAPPPHPQLKEISPFSKFRLNCIGLFGSIESIFMEEPPYPRHYAMC